MSLLYFDYDEVSEKVLLLKEVMGKFLNAYLIRNS